MDDAPAPQPLLTTPPEPIQAGGSVTRRGLRGLLSFVTFFLLGVVLGVVLIGAGIQPSTSLPLTALLLLLLPSLWLTTLVHELGHALAARQVGWQVLAIAVGPLALQRTADGLRLARNPLNRLLGGYIYAIPSEDRQLRRRRFVIVAGGPLASLLAALLAAAYLVATDGDDLLPTAVFQVGLLSAITALLTIVPYRYRGLTSDGGQMLNLLRGGPAAEQQLAIQLLVTALVGGVRPRDLDEALLDRAVAATGPTDAISARNIAYWREMDRGNVAGAAAHLDSALAHRAATTTAGQAALAAEAAYLTARFDPTPNAAATAAAWLQLAKPTGSPDSNYRRAEAAVHLVAGRAAEARAAADDALRLLRQSIDAGGAAAEREWLHALRAAAGGAA